MIAFPMRRRIEYPRGHHSTLSNRYDQEFLTRIIAQKDPLLQRLNSVASFVLDDHPYPRNAKDFQRRTIEINRNIRHLHLSSSDQKFLDRLMMETGVSVVRSLPLSLNKPTKIHFLFRSTSGKVHISSLMIKAICTIVGRLFAKLAQDFPLIIRMFPYNNMVSVSKIINYSSVKQAGMAQHGFKWKHMVSIRTIF